MREGFRPYTKLITLNSTTRTSVAFRDTGNNSINCNYIKVEPVSGTPDDGLFYVTPTGPSTELGASNTLAATALPVDATASGNCGGVASCLNGTVVLSLISPDFSNSCFISQTTTDPVVYGITYGVVQESNNLKDSREYRGK